MVKAYAKAVERGYILWTEVPMYWRADVMEKIMEDGYKLNPDGTVEKIEG